MESKRVEYIVQSRTKPEFCRPEDGNANWWDMGILYASAANAVIGKDKPGMKNVITETRAIKRTITEEVL